MVCLDNIYLSPLAAGLLNFAAETKGFAEHMEIDSAGFKVLKAGAAPDSRILSTAENHGFTLTHEARELDAEDLDYFDEILVMDEAIQTAVLAVAKTPVQKAKVRLLTEYDPRKDKQDDIANPWNDTSNASQTIDAVVFEEAYEQLWYCCMGFLKRAA